MNKYPKYRIAFSLLALLLNFGTAYADLVISEFMASNSTTIVDEDGEYSDWIEIHNTGSASENLEGWYLTDNDNFTPTDSSTFWEFPARTLVPGQRLIVFASGNDRAEDSGELHTNFKLSSDGEYLALIKPDGTSITSEFAPEYPPQQTDISYGIGLSTGETETYISELSPVKLRIPNDNSEGSEWFGAANAFDDSNWTDSTTAIGFDAGAGAAGFTLIENFDSLNQGPLDGQGSWTSSTSEAIVDLDPENVGNQIARIGGSNSNTYKPINLANGETSTLFFRIRRDGPLNASAGASDSSSPNQWSNYEVQLNTQLDTIMKVRDGGGFDDVDEFADNTWYLVWMVVDNAADDYRVFMQGGALQEQTLLDDGAQTEFGFRNGPTSNALETFFAKYSDNSDGFMLLDDIYVGAGENLGTPIGGTGYASLISDDGDIEELMLDTNSSAYIRIPFDIADVSENTLLSLQMRYDDGFIAYLNGTEVASRNAPASPAWNSASTAEQLPADAIQFEEIDITSFLSELAPNTTNILAIHGLNTTNDDTDFLISPKLIAAEFSTTEEAVYFREATPNEENADGYIGLIDDTNFSHNRGFYETAFNVEIISTTEGATIIYTTDGSTPSLQNGTQATSPATVDILTTTTLRAIAVKNGYLPTNVDTQTYIFLADVINQGNSPEGFPSTWLGSNGGGTFPADYEMDPDVTTDPNYSDRIGDALLSLPTISIVTDQEHFFDTSTGIYQRPQQSGSAWERPVSVEIIQPDGTLENTQIDAGIRIQGGHTRNPSNNPKHSFRLIFKSEYGASKLEYNLFPDDPEATQEFDQLILRGAGNQSWLHHNTFKGDNRGRAQYVRDQWAKDVQLDMGHPGLRNTHAHLYINGVYWGVYNPTERATSGHGEAYLGGDKDDYVALNSGEEVSGDELALTEFQALVDLADSDITDSIIYAQMTDILDIEAFADYMILQQYAGNVDWPHHNWYALRNTDGGKWYFICWDSEFIFVEPDANVIDQNIHDREGPPLDILDRLILNDEFRLFFADRIQKYLFNDGLLTEDKILEAWNKRSDEIFEPLVAESARWGDYRRDVHSRGSPTPIPLYDPDEEWMVERERLLTQYFPFRTQTVIDQYRAIGYFPELDAPVLSTNSATVEAGSTISISSPDGGSIYYTTDGSDPRLSGSGNPSPNAQIYGDELIINNTQTLRARVLSGGEWSPIIEATYQLALDSIYESLVVSEIMYNLDGPDDAEFIELYNVGTETIDLTGVSFSEGIEFQFADGYQLAPSAYTLIVRDETAFIEQFGSNHPIAGVFANDTALDNGGETITLVTADLSVIQSFTYDDSDPWPSTPDGDGFSLELINPESRPDHTNPANWQASAQVGGTPAITFDGNDTDDLDNDGAPALLEYIQGTSDDDANDQGMAFFIFESEGSRFLSILVNPALRSRLTILSSTNLESEEPADSLLELQSKTPSGNSGQEIELYKIMDNNTHFFRLKAE
ncbi:lamin tail domain-containing protein [Puniceicoccaceae bacterium K14]|nr:lamin tail domain-containing protein [Puniceicoccaceae bacterium K14]